MTNNSHLTKQTVRLTYRDVPVELEATDLDTAAVEQLITRLLGRAGWSAPKLVGGYGGPRKPQTPPHIAADGAKCCPHHPNRRLNQREFGWTCGERVPVGDPLANKHGYCKYVWRDEGGAASSAPAPTPHPSAPPTTLAEAEARFVKRFGPWAQVFVGLPKPTTIVAWLEAGRAAQANEYDQIDAAAPARNGAAGVAR